MSDPDYTLCEEDFIACNVVGAEEGVWKGVMEVHGLRWDGHSLNAAIVFGFAESMRDFANPL